MWALFLDHHRRIGLQSVHQLYGEINKFQGFPDLGQKPLIQIGTISKGKKKKVERAQLKFIRIWDLGSFHLSDLNDDV